MKILKISDSQSRPLEYIPWLVFASLLAISLCVVVSIIIISISNNQAVKSWSIQPSVLLNLLNSFSNIALGTAFSVGIANTWWTSATDGATLVQLHYIWDTGGGISLFYALTTGGNAKKVALTTLAIGKHHYFILGIKEIDKYVHF